VCQDATLKEIRRARALSWRSTDKRQSVQLKGDVKSEDEEAERLEEGFQGGRLTDRGGSAVQEIPVEQAASALKNDNQAARVGMGAGSAAISNKDSAPCGGLQAPWEGQGRYRGVQRQRGERAARWDGQRGAIIGWLPAIYV